MKNSRPICAALLLTATAAVPLTAAPIAHSLIEFSQTQGNEGWYQGYRNLSVDGGAQNYNPSAAFIPFPAATWVGTGFDLGGGDPWTEIFNEGAHPNNGSAHHWIIRRWKADELSGITPLAM
jgi:hypothetical protein